MLDIKFNRRLSGGTKILRNSLLLTELAKPFQLLKTVRAIGPQNGQDKFTAFCSKVYYNESK